MKVLMVSRWLGEERRRNGDKPGFFGELALAIAAKGFDLTILSQAADAGPVPEPRPIDGLNLHVFSRDGRSFALSPIDKIYKLWSGYRKAATDAAVIRHFVRQHGPFDAVVAQCEEPDGFACALATRAKEFPPLVTCVHDLRYQFRNDGVHFIRKSSLGFVFQKSARVVANSAQTAIWLQREYGVPENRIGQCRIHLTAPFLAEAAQNSAPIETTEKRILFLGALNRKKAPDVFLRAAKLLAPDLPGWTFVIVGSETTEDAPFFSELKALSSSPGLAGQVKMLGRLEPSAVIEQIRRARIVVCPSIIETFSRTTIEALALGRPVIVTETTGAAHWVQSTGCGTVVPSNNPGTLADAMLDWTSRETIPDASAQITSELTASRAAEDLIREITAAIHRK